MYSFLERYARTYSFIMGVTTIKNELNLRAEQALHKAISKLKLQEERPEQIQMCQFLLRFLNYANAPGHAAMVEAGTGVGKSFGYLVAASEWLQTMENAPKVVIATNTISLQEQLTSKDIPAINTIYPRVTFAKAKGRNNYICKYKLNQSLEGNLFMTGDESEKIEQITEWLSGRGKSGDRSDLDFDIDTKLWQSLCSESFDCLGMSCPHQGACYYNKGKKELEKADIIVTTHAMVLSDLAQKPSLPEYQVLIIDEGHNFEKNASNAFTETVSKRHINRLLLKSQNQFCQNGFRESQNIRKVNEWRKTVKDCAELFFGQLKEGRVINTQENLNGENLLNSLKMVYLYINESLKKTELAISKTELLKLMEETAIIEKTLQSWLHQGETHSVYWVENNEIKYVPINVGFLLDRLWNSKNTILTSATLCVAKQFDTIRNSLHLNKDTTYSLRLESPFNYKENALVYLPPTAPSPKAAGYTDYVSETVFDILQKTGGKTFILFTSYSMMQQVYESVSNRLNNKFTWLLQGANTRERLLLAYRQNQNAVLFGTDTFWEGIDEDLNCVIITKLPFAVPTDPVEEARCESIRSRGGNPFTLQAIPRCAIKLKQGTGRLIRHQNKRGVIVICDPRITQPWGKVIIKTLPEMQITGDDNKIPMYLEKLA